jgi:hypothetical protein
VERELLGAVAPPSVTRRPVTLILRKVARKPEDILEPSSSCVIRCVQARGPGSSQVSPQATVSNDATHGAHSVTCRRRSGATRGRGLAMPDQTTPDVPSECSPGSRFNGRWFCVGAALMLRPGRRVVGPSARRTAPEVYARAYP